MNQEYFLWGTAMGLSVFTVSLYATNFYRGYKAKREQEPLRKELVRFDTEMGTAMANLEKTIDNFGNFSDSSPKLRISLDRKV